MQPNAKKDCLEGIRDGHLVIRLNSPPVDGKANKALIKFMAACLDIPKSRLSIVRGEKSRLKVLAAADLTPDTVRERLGLTR